MHANDQLTYITKHDDYDYDYKYINLDKDIAVKL